MMPTFNDDPNVILQADALEHEDNVQDIQLQLEPHTNPIMVEDEDKIGTQTGE